MIGGLVAADQGLFRGPKILQHKGEERMVDEGRVALYCIGQWPNDRTYIESLDPQRYWKLDFEAKAIFRWMCVNAVDPTQPDMPAEFIGVVRIRRCGQQLGCYPEFFQEPPTERNQVIMRSEERRVGKECRSRWAPY